jgi:hypothetical protein
MSQQSLTWRRRDVPQAALSILQHSQWASFEDVQADRGILYQRFGASGMAFVSYGPDATVQWQLAHLAARQSTHVLVEADETVRFAGASARRVRLRLQHAPTAAHQRGPSGLEALPQAHPEIFVCVGLVRLGTPILVGYRVAEPELAAFQSSLDHMLSEVRAL